MSNISPHQALELLKQGQVVALPTETVYGLAGLIESDVALQRIFSVKQRPFFDPLIVHVKDLNQALPLAQWDDVSLKLADYFWPGPITFVLNKTNLVSDLITSGGPTVGIRAPNHPITQKILTDLDKAFAAPSANRFGHTSPTEAKHVAEEFTGEVPVVDGGPCEKGIESTVVQMNSSTGSLLILRPGVISQRDLEKALEELGLKVSVEYKEQSNAPGHLKNHYQPTVPLVLFENLQKPLPSEILLPEGHTAKSWVLPESPELAARKLYSDLRKFSSENQAIYLVIPSSWQSLPDWKALLDRLHKACHFYGFVDDDEKIRLMPKT